MRTELNTPGDSQSIQGNPHTLGFLQHAQIKREILSLQDDREYSILEIVPNGVESISHHTGRDIKENYPILFGTYTHGFIVREVETGTLVFVYNGPIPNKVNIILASTTLH